ncbi:MAG TPA: hypothetical protein VN635_11520 [Conexibacter sp.]|nr:hypothetical protein [Conexibacter sp.]
MKRLALLMVAVALALVVAGPAYAQSATSDAYAGKGGGIVGTVNSGGPSGNGPSAPAPQQVQAASSNGSLPFTGLDVGLLALGGVALVGVGIGLRRFARPLS